jgi:hypothetical protein
MKNPQGKWTYEISKINTDEKVEIKAKALVFFQCKKNLFEFFEIFGPHLFEINV